MPQYTVRDESSGRTVVFDWTGAEPPTDADMAEVFAAAGGSQPDAPAPAEERPIERAYRERFGADTPEMAAAMREFDAGRDAALPTSLAMAGGAFGGIPGAALGGYVGSRALGKDIPTAATDGAVQGGIEAAGGLIGKGLQRGGQAVYRGLLKPSRAIRDSFGGDDVVRTLIDEGATISRKGAEKVTGRLSGSRQSALKMVSDAAPTSTLVQPEEVIREFAPVVKLLRQRANVGQADELAKVGARGKRLVRSLGRGAGVDAAGAQVAKETAQDAASGAYRMVERGGAKQLGADDLLDEATARGFRKAVEKRVPGVAAQNQQTQRLLGASRALDDAIEGRANNLAVGGARDLISMGVGAGAGAATTGPVGLSAGLLTRLLSSPRAGSAMAIAMDRTGKNVPIDDLIRALTLLGQEAGRE